MSKLYLKKARDGNTSRTSHNNVGILSHFTLFLYYVGVGMDRVVMSSRLYPLSVDH